MGSLTLSKQGVHKYNLIIVKNVHEENDGCNTGYSPPPYVDCAVADGVFPDPHNCRGSVFQFIFLAT